MPWIEMTVVVLLLVLGMVVLGAYRVRADDPAVTHFWQGLSREENGRFGTFVGAIGLVVISAIDLTFFSRYPLLAIGWGILMVLLAYRGWVRGGKKGASGKRR